MTIDLAATLAEVSFPMYAIHPRHWRGVAYVGDVDRQDETITSVTLVYEERRRAVGVDNVRSGWGQIEDDFVRFVSRFDPGAMTKRVRRGRRPFPKKSFVERGVETSVLGAPRVLRVLEHRDLPLTMAPLTLEGVAGTTDVWVMAWEADVRDLVPLIEPLDPSMVGAFGSPDDEYPPPEWVEDAEA